ncbi:mucin-5AC-like [Kryptolebias marmoratus]|uniref:mucin-5AC-like n=1 Tax=Kryptolebias marmoratus TaxID=37003 RepID=UPI0007F8F04C|nr:mucin-5AC-like [Kryptolebias marmoratus]
MELLKIALFVVLLTVISAKPVRHDADIPEKNRSLQRMTDGDTGSEDSKESSESDSFEESDSSEERTSVSTDRPALVRTTAAMTTITSGDGSTPNTEPDTQRPSVTKTTPEPFPSITSCVTVEISSQAPVTGIRGDM